MQAEPKKRGSAVHDDGREGKTQPPDRDQSDRNVNILHPPRTSAIEQGRAGDGLDELHEAELIAITAAADDRRRIYVPLIARPAALQPLQRAVFVKHEIGRATKMPEDDEVGLFPGPKLGLVAFTHKCVETLDNQASALWRVRLQGRVLDYFKLPSQLDRTVQCHAASPEPKLSNAGVLLTQYSERLARLKAAHQLSLLEVAGSLLPCHDQFMAEAANANKKDDRARLVQALLKVGEGDRSAFAEVYRNTSAKLFGICLRILSDRSEAEEVLQEAYVNVWRKAGAFDPERSSPITWLAALARNKAIDRLRSRRAGPVDGLSDEAYEVPDPGASALDTIEAGQDGQRLQRCMDTLEDKQAGAIRQAFFAGLSYPELASRQDLPLGTVKSWIRRGLLRLKECLER